MRDRKSRNTVTARSQSAFDRFGVTLPIRVDETPGNPRPAGLPVVPCDPLCNGYCEPPGGNVATVAAMASDKFSKFMQEAADLAREERQEGYNEGVTATITALEEFLSSLRAKLGSAPSEKRETTTDPASAVQRQAPASRIRRPSDKERAPRMSAGTLNQIVADAYKSISPSPASPTTIQIWIRDNRGEELAFTSLRRAIDRLTSQGVLEEIADTKTWRHREVKKTEEPSGGTPGSSNPGGVVPLRR